MDFPNEKPAKVILIGNSSVGKTSMLIQLHKKIFEKDVEPTIGTSYINEEFEVSDKKVPLNIWDTAGQERFKSVVPMYVRGASAVIFVCATDSLESVKSLDKWYQIAQEITINPKYYVVLNKIDLECQFDEQLPSIWAANHDFKYFRTTAKNLENINDMFTEVARDMLETLGPSSFQPIVEEVPSQNIKRKQYCC